MEKIPFWKCPGECLLKNTEQNTWKKLVITLICGLRLKALVICTKIDWPCGEWVDLKISCGCISGYQARKGLHIETVKFDLHKFCHLKKLYWQLYWLFSNKKTYYKMTFVKNSYTFQNQLKNRTPSVLPAEKFWNIILAHSFIKNNFWLYLGLKFPFWTNRNFWFKKKNSIKICIFNCNKCFLMRL